MISSSQRTMWQAALLQTIDDAINGVAGPSREADKRLKQIKAARLYLTEPNEDCDMVCAMAGIDPDALRRRIQILLVDAATPEELVSRKRKSGTGRKLTLNGETKTITEWADHLNMNPNGLCCTNQLRDSLYESSVVAGGYEQLVPYEVQDQELAFVQHGAKAARFAINLV